MCSKNPSGHVAGQAEIIGVHNDSSEHWESMSRRVGLSGRVAWEDLACER